MGLFKHTGEVKRKLLLEVHAMGCEDTFINPYKHNFRVRLLELVLPQRKDPTVVYKVPTISLQLPQPALPPNTAAVPNPTTEETRAQHKTSKIFQKQSSK